MNSSLQLTPADILETILTSDKSIVAKKHIEYIDVFCFLPDPGSFI